ncbi:hypothetical protein DICPUDRAFT_152384 [Dictyostelium purpureum]|uniref:SUI1 domain-containing protein n=1 Tax=Dictyostelium purpureum TaxID=5786 RepID=F0ZL76_DICPU|nr:uncharacterized protein DICPUDRAFT_152384 [Dictyostelium purpureum]EGC35310.1 hypothetical protein DICPUDRAFT_152384 [Dictyostelium purpureum]|eukprot:XP_003288177.1 hypothetical protein DICPUDRAFT_152384 [Dictyostelium purpureum]
MSNKRHLFKHQLNISSQSIMRGSDVKKLKQKLLDTYKNISTEQLDVAVNKKKDVGFVKLPNKIQIISQENNPIFFEFYDKLYPTIYTFFKIPTFFTIIYIYPLVYQYIESGADLMFQGILNKDDVPKKEGQLVSVCLKGSNYPIAFGETIQNITEPTDGITPIEYKGKAISIIHYLNDKLWEYGTKKLPDDFSIPKQPSEDNEDDEEVEEEEKENEKEIDSPTTTTATTTTTTTTTTSTTTTDEPNIEALKINDENITKEEMDEILLTSFLGAIKKGISDSELPIVLKTVFSKYMIYYQPLGKPEINLKKSSYKKVSVFMKEMEKKGLIDLKEPTPGNIVISRIFRNHPLYSKFKLGEITGPNNSSKEEDEEESDQETDAFGTTEIQYTPIKTINEVYILPKPLKEYLKEKQLADAESGSDDENNDNCEDDQDKNQKLIEKLNRKYYLAPEIQKVLSSYIIDYKLEDPVKRSKIKIDSFLASFLPQSLKRNDTVGSLMEKGQFFMAFKETLKKYLEIIRTDGSIEHKEFCEITIQVKKISNRFVILVTNLELFNIPVKELAQEGMKIFAASTSIDYLNNHKAILKIQGNDINRVSQHIQKKYNIPKKYIIETEFVKNKKK